MFSFNDQVRAAPDVLFNDLEGEAVLLDLKSELYFSLDDIGTRMWKPLGENIQPGRKRL